MQVDPAVFVIEDDVCVSGWMRRLLDENQIRHLMFEDAASFLRHMRPGVPGCIVTDFRLRGPSGLYLLEELRRRRIHRPVIVMTAYGDVETALRFLRLGALDFLEKPFPPERLLAAVRQGLELERAAARHESAALPFRSRLESLSQCEHEILMLVLSGHPNKRIARMLGVAARTVEARRSRMMAKLHMKSLNELVLVFTEWQVRLPADVRTFSS